MRTDHAARTFLHKFADNNSRQMRWSLRLAEFDFEIEHVPGSKIKHVDPLSRHVGLVSARPPVTKGMILEGQKTDQFCISQSQKRLTRKSEFFLDVDGVFYRRRKGKDNQIVIPRSMTLEVICSNHDPKFVAHPGSKRKYERISLKYWWPKMREMVEDCYEV